MGPAILLDWLCSKIDRVVRSSFEAEINSAQLALDHMEYIHAMFVMARKGFSAREYRSLKEREEAVLVGDNKGLYTAAHAANPITTKGEKRLTIDKVLMRDHLEDHRVKYRWTNAGHQLADGFTKLSVSGARSDLLLEAISTGQIRIHYSQVSGRKEAEANKQKKSQRLKTEEGLLVQHDKDEPTNYELVKQQGAEEFNLDTDQMNQDDREPSEAAPQVSWLDELDAWWRS